MIVDFNYLEERYHNEKKCPEIHGVFVDAEVFVLIRELLKALEKMRAEIIRLREDINDLTSDEAVYPYPEEALPEESHYFSEHMLYLYKCFFSELPGSDESHF
jgi:hypothetical protein